MDSFKTYLESFLCEKRGRPRTDEIRYIDKDGQEVKFICVTPEKSGAYKKFKLDGDETEKTFSYLTVANYREKTYSKSTILDEIHGGKTKGERHRKDEIQYTDTQGQEVKFICVTPDKTG